MWVMVGFDLEENDISSHVTEWPEERNGPVSGKPVRRLQLTWEVREPMASGISWGNEKEWMELWAIMR